MYFENCFHLVSLSFQAMEWILAHNDDDDDDDEEEMAQGKQFGIKTLLRIFNSSTKTLSA
jgi:hypothetical protein